MSTESELATVPVAVGFHKATSQLSAALGIEPRMMIESIKKQCFPSMRAEDVSDSQLAAFISVANAMDYNPLIPGMLYAYPGKNGGIVPVTGPDGVLKKLDEAIMEGKIDGFECTVFPEDVTQKPTHAVAIITRTGKPIPSKFTAIFSEWVVGSNPNWGSRPRHMIWLRAIKQCARQVIHGVPFDEDDVKIGEMVNVTPESEKVPDRLPPPPKAKKGVNAITDPPKPDPKNEAIEAEIVKPKAEEAPPAAPEPPKAPASIARAFLKDKEEFTGICKIEKVSAFSMLVAGVPTPTVSAVVSGDFTGTVMHIGGGVALPEPGKFAPSPEWEVGSTVTLHLLGKGALTTKKNDKGEIAKDDKGVAIKVPTTLHTVIKIVPQEAASESPAVEMDE